MADDRSSNGGADANGEAFRALRRPPAGSPVKRAVTAFENLPDRVQEVIYNLTNPDDIEKQVKGMRLTADERAQIADFIERLRNVSPEIPAVRNAVSNNHNGAPAEVPVPPITPERPINAAALENPIIKLAPTETVKPLEKAETAAVKNAEQVVEKSGSGKMKWIVGIAAAVVAIGAFLSAQDKPKKKHPKQEEILRRVMAEQGQLAAR